MENLPHITTREYAEAVILLLSKARGPHGCEAEICAQVLLSAYNGFDWQLNVARLYSLSRERYRAAITVIRGRAELAQEPQDCIKDGDHHFERLCQRWVRLHRDNRHKDICSYCDGSGYIFYDKKGKYLEGGKRCNACRGNGFLGGEA